MCLFLWTEATAPYFPRWFKASPLNKSDSMFEQVFPQHDLRVVNLAEVINTKIDRMLIDSLHTFDLLHRKRKTKDIKRFFYHHIALTICEEFTADLTAGKCIFFFNPSEVGNLELYNYY